MTDSYQVFYRKYRPKSFNKLIGQEHIKDVLMKSIINNEINHAYIFTGPRGTGKTSTAYIFSKAINCLSNNQGEACNQCKNCQLIDNNQSFDIYEIDAASNNSVESVRNLTEKVVYNPLNLKYKIYIIDEVHMLSKSAFNALLKTMENPPKHVIFILATTEIKKIPLTILSRVQKFTFKNVDYVSLSNYLQEICQLENIKIKNNNILFDIVHLSDRCVRDSLSNLEQLAIYQNDEINNIGLLELFNYLDFKTQINIIKTIISAEQSAMIKLISSLNQKNIDYFLLVDSLIRIINDDLNNTEKIFVDYNKILNLLKELIKLKSVLQSSKNPKLDFQLLLLINIKKQVIKPLNKVKSKIISQVKQTNILEKKSFSITECFNNNDTKLLLDLKEKWTNLNQSIIQNKKLLSALFLTNAKPLKINNDNLIIGFKEIINRDNFNINKDNFINIINDILKTNFKIEAITRKEFLEIQESQNNKNDLENPKSKNNIKKYRDEIFN